MADPSAPLPSDPIALTLANIGLAYSVAARWHRISRLANRLGTVEDARQVAAATLFKTVKHYDPERPSKRTGKPVKFTTYASRAIWRELSRTAWKGGIIPLPFYLFSKPLDSLPEGLRRAVQLSLGMRQWPILENEAVDTFDVQAPEPDEPPAEPDEIDQLRDAMRFLPSREQDVLRRRFGLGCPEQTLNAIGKQYGFSRERARMIEARALEKLRRLLCPKVA